MNQIQQFSRSLCKTAACAAVGSLFAVSAHAQDIVIDNFTGRTAANLCDGTSQYEIPFFTNNGSATTGIPTSSVSYLDTDRVKFVTWGGNRSLVGTLYNSMASATSITLGTTVGSKLELTFDFAFANGNGTGTSDWVNVGDTTLHFGLYNSNTTTTTGNGQTTSNNDNGYFGRIGVKALADAGIFKETGANATAGNGTDVTALTADTFAFTPGTAKNQLRYTARYIIERVTAAEVRIRFVILQDGATIASAGARDATPYTTFDEVVIGLGSGAYRHDLQIDNLVVRKHGPSPKPKWAPPALTNPITKTISSGNQNVTLQSAGADYIINITDRLDGDTGGLDLNCGNAKNVVIIGGEIDVPWVVQEYTVGDTWGNKRRGLKVANWTGTLHIEGLWIHGTDLAEGINISAPSPTSILQLQNIRVDDVHSRQEELDCNWVGAGVMHPDIIQTWCGPSKFYIDRLTGSSDYQGIFLQPGDNDIMEIIFKNTDLHATNFTQGGTFLVYYFDSDMEDTPVLWEFWIQPRVGAGVWPQGDTEFAGAQVGNHANFVHESVPGMYYISPGYNF